MKQKLGLTAVLFLAVLLFTQCIFAENLDFPFEEAAWEDAFEEAEYQDLVDEEDSLTEVFTAEEVLTQEALTEEALMEEALIENADFFSAYPESAAAQEPSFGPESDALTSAWHGLESVPLGPGQKVTIGSKGQEGTYSFKGSDFLGSRTEGNVMLVVETEGLFFLELTRQEPNAAPTEEGIILGSRWAEVDGAAIPTIFINTASMVLNKDVTYTFHFYASERETSPTIDILWYTVSAGEVFKSGKCGQNLNWELSMTDPEGLELYYPYHDDTWDGYFTIPSLKLSITGSGAMYDYNKDWDIPENQWTPAPWYFTASWITEVELPKGLESIGNWALASFSNLRSIQIPEGVTRIGESALRDCNRGYSDAQGTYSQVDSLRSVTLPSSLREIGRAAFIGNLFLESVNYPGSLVALANICAGQNGMSPANRLRDCFGGNTPWARETYDDLTIPGFGKEFILPTDWSESGISRGGALTFTLKDVNPSYTSGTYVIRVNSEGLSGASIHLVNGEYDRPRLEGSGTPWHRDDTGKIIYSSTYMIPVELDAAKSYSLIVNPQRDEEKSEIKVSVEILPFYSVLDSGTTSKGIKWEIVGLDPKGFTGYDPNHDETWDGYYTRMTFTLKISGSGEMDDYFINYQNRSEDQSAPWSQNYNQSIQKIEIGSGVTHIGNWAFEGISLVRELVVPEGVTSIGENAFRGMNLWNGGTQPVDGLRKVTLPSSLTSIGSQAFIGNRFLETVEYPGTLLKLRDICQGLYSAFDGGSIWAQNTFADIELKEPNKKYTLYTDAAGILRNGYVNFRPADFNLHAGTYTVTITADTRIIATIGKVTLNEQGFVINQGERVGDSQQGSVNGTTYSFDVVLEENQAYNLHIHATQLEPASYTVSYRFDEKSDDTLVVPKTSYKLTYSAKAQTIKLGATASAKITYSSNNAKVTVSSKGKVTVAKKFMGKAKITVKAGSQKQTVTITVNPLATTLSSLKSSKAKQLTVKWKKGTAMTGYQLQYADNKSFSSAKTKTAKKTATTATLTGLTSGKTWYVRIRAYKTVDGTKYYSAWSAALKKKVK